MKILRFFTFCLMLVSLEAWSQNIPVPIGYSVIESSMGDLDGDNVEELVVAYDTKLEDDSLDGIERELRIFKRLNEHWEIWITSENALLNSLDGGMYGDPFGEIKVENGLLKISHLGGTSWKWFNTDTYKLENNDFKLVHYSTIYGRPCDYWGSFDFNLDTGAILFTKETENCESDEQVISKIEKEEFNKPEINLYLSNRYQKSMHVVSSKYGLDLYL